MDTVTRFNVGLKKKRNNFSVLFVCAGKMDRLHACIPM
jgi:hypothetical protein